MIAGRMEPFDRDDLLVGNIFHRGDAGTHRLPAGMHGACPAKRLAAAIYFVPVRPTSSRRYQSSGSEGSPSHWWASPLTVSVIMVALLFDPAAIGAAETARELSKSKPH